HTDECHGVPPVSTMAAEGLGGVLVFEVDREETGDAAADTERGPKASVVEAGVRETAGGRGVAEGGVESLFGFGGRLIGGAGWRRRRQSAWTMPRARLVGVRVATGTSCDG